MKITYREEIIEIGWVPEAAETATSTEAAEQQEMNNFNQEADSQQKMQEQQEMDAGEKLGYSSEYYEHEMESAIKNGNKIAFENAQKNFAHEKTKELAREAEKKA